MSSLADLEPFLARVAEQLEATGSAAEIYDREWNLVWLTSQFRFFAGDRPLEQLGLGKHPVTVRTNNLDGMVPLDIGVTWMRKNIPLMAHDTPGGMDAIRALLPADHDRAIGPLEPQPPQTLWWGELTYLQGALPPAQTRYFTFALHDPGGERVGWAILYLPAAPARIVSLITRGNQGMFARMAELLEPARLTVTEDGLHWHPVGGDLASSPDMLVAPAPASLAEGKRLITERFLALRLADGSLPQPYHCAV